MYVTSGVESIKFSGLSPLGRQKIKVKVIPHCQYCTGDKCTVAFISNIEILLLKTDFKLLETFQTRFINGIYW